MTEAKRLTPEELEAIRQEAFTDVVAAVENGEDYSLTELTWFEHVEALLSHIEALEGQVAELADLGWQELLEERDEAIQQRDELARKFVDIHEYSATPAARMWEVLLELARSYLNTDRPTAEELRTEQEQQLKEDLEDHDGQRMADLNAIPMPPMCGMECPSDCDIHPYLNAENVDDPCEHPGILQLAHQCSTCGEIVPDV